MMHVTKQQLQGTGLSARIQNDRNEAGTRGVQAFRVRLADLKQYSSLAERSATDPDKLR